MTSTIKPEPSESVLTIEMLNDVLAKMPLPRDDRIFVVSEGYWPHHSLKLTKDNGKYFILNDVGFRNLKRKGKCDVPQLSCNGAISFSGIKIEYINAEKATEIICEHISWYWKNYES